MNQNSLSDWARDFAAKVMRATGFDPEDQAAWTQSSDCLTWDLDTVCEHDFMDALAKAADYVAAKFTYANLDGEELETIQALSARIGNIAFSCERADCGYLLAFEATHCQTEEQATASTVIHAQTVTNAVASSYGRSLMAMAANNKGLSLGRAIAMVLRAVRFTLNERESDALSQWLHGHETAINTYMAQRIADGDLEAWDVPSRLAHYGLMDPECFRSEMLERMGDPDLSTDSSP